MPGLCFFLWLAPVFSQIAEDLGEGHLLLFQTELSRIIAPKVKMMADTGATSLSVGTSSEHKLVTLPKATKQTEDIVSKTAVRETVEVNGDPWFCHGLDCPEFTTRWSTAGTEVRSYTAVLWASTTIESDDIYEAENEGFRRLFKYISGENEEGMKVDMTSPVLNMIKPAAGPACNSTFTISFMVPWALQAQGMKPPMPKDERIIFRNIGGFQVAVRTGNGYWLGPTRMNGGGRVLIEAEALGNDVANDPDLSLNGEIYFFAGYDPPFRPILRHNEIWWPVKWSGDPH